jgi:hypothetical protein
VKIQISLAITCDSLDCILSATQFTEKLLLEYLKCRILQLASHFLRLIRQIFMIANQSKSVSGEIHVNLHSQDHDFGVFQQVFGWEMA